MRYLFSLLILPLFCFAQERTYEVIDDTTKPRVLQIDQLNLDVSVAFEPENGKVLGSAKIVFSTLDQSIDSLWLDGVAMNYKSVILDGKRVPYRMFRKGVALLPEQPLHPQTNHDMRIDYEATPKRGLFFVGWEDKTNRAQKQIWTQGQGIDHRHWIPHVDAQNDKVITSLTVSFDTAYQVISNGVLENYMEVGDMGHWNYAMENPHSSYLMMLAIGKYDVIEDGANGTRILNFYYPQWKDRYATTYFQNSSIFRFLEGEIGVPYPWQNYKQVPVMNFQHGAMENTSATIFGDFFCVDSFSFNDRNYVGVNAHELAHQWFGNLVTATHSTHHWLHEGFATYYQWLIEKEVFGPDRFAVIRKESLERVLMADEIDNYPLAHGKAGSARFYDKGAWVLMMLREAIGERAWQVGIKAFLTQNEFGMAQTTDFKEAMQRSCDCDLDLFFDQWVYKPKLPEFNMRIELVDDEVKIFVEQQLLVGQPFYKIAIPVKVITSKGERMNTLSFDDEYALIANGLDKKERLIAVIPDPEFRFPANWTIDAPLFVLENAASHPTAHWYFAALALPKHVDYNPEIAEAISNASLLNRLAFAEALGKKTSTQEALAEEEIAFLGAEKSLEVAKSFLKQTTYLQPEVLPVVEKWLTWPSYDLVDLALVRLCINDRENAKRYLDETTHLEGTNGHNVRITWLLLSSVFVDQGDVVKLVDYMSPAYDFLTRMNAFNAASQLSYVNYKVADHAFSTLFQYNRKLRARGRDFIKQMIANEETKKPFQLWVNRNQKLLTVDQLDLIERMTGLKPEG